MTCLFIGTLKVVAFEWFMKLPVGSIKTWADMKKLFLTRFFENDMEVAMLTLLATKQKKGESIKAFVKRFIYGTLLSKWHVPIHTGENMPLQPTDCTPRPDRSGGMPHLKAAGATRRVVYQ